MSVTAINTLADLNAFPRAGLSDDYVLMADIDASPTNPANVTDEWDIATPYGYSAGDYVHDGTNTYLVLVAINEGDLEVGTSLADVPGDIVAEMWPHANGFAPIGTAVARFRGSFSGNGHKINNLYINRLGADNVALFAYTTTVVSISDVKLENINITGNATRTSGLVAYDVGADIDRVHVSGVINGSDQSAAIAGRLVGNVSNCFSSCEVNGAYYTGGIVGTLASGSTVSNSLAVGAVTSSATSSGTCIGGVVGYDGGGTVTNSYYDSVSTGMSDTSKGVGLTTAEMKQIATYSGWDFDDVWLLNHNYNNGYPGLRSFFKQNRSAHYGIDGTALGGRSSFGQSRRLPDDIQTAITGAFN